MRVRMEYANQLIADPNTGPKTDEGEEKDDGSLDYVNIIFIFYNTENVFSTISFPPFKTLYRMLYYYLYCQSG